MLQQKYYHKNKIIHKYIVLGESKIVNDRWRWHKNFSQMQDHSKVWILKIRFILYFQYVIVGRGIRDLNYRLKFRVLISNVGSSYLLKNHIVKLSSAQLCKSKDAIGLQVRWCIALHSQTHFILCSLHHILVCCK